MGRFVKPEELVYDLNGIVIDDVVEQIGPGGPGVINLRGILNNEFILELVSEYEDESMVHWWDAGSTYANNRSVKIVQNHDVFALKLSAGDQGPVNNVPSMSRLAASTEWLINHLSIGFPNLSGWTADEMSYHRYYDNKIGLSHHRDNARFTGLIAVASIFGEADFSVIEREPLSMEYDEELGIEVVSQWLVKNELIIPTSPGDLVLTRATDLYNGMKAKDRPEHAVFNIREVPRVSFMLRANARPLEENYDFTYFNWPKSE